MSFLRHASLRHKQLVIMMLTSGVALLLAGGGFVLSESLSFRQSLARNLSSLADILGQNSTASLDFNSSKDAEEVLAGLRADPHIVWGGLYSKEGRLFAAYRREPTAQEGLPATAPPDGSRFHPGCLDLVKPITLKGERIGTVYLRSDLSALAARLREFLVIAMLVFGVAVFGAFLVSTRLQRFISEPILKLAQAARAAALQKDYSVRVARQSQDEVGHLIDGFNEMLTQIQTRDAALQQAHDSLERRVEERTRELEQSLSVLHATLESTADGLLVVDRDQHVTHVNGKFLAMWRIPTALQGSREDRQLLEAVRDQLEDPAGFLRKVHELYARPEAESHDLIRFKDGRIFERFSQPHQIAGKHLGRVWSFRDITERKLAEAELRHERDRAQQYLDIAGVMIVVLDADGRVVLLNQRGCALLGYQSEEILGRDWFEIGFAPEVRPEMRRAYARIMAGEVDPPGSVQSPMVTRGGKPRLLAFHTTVLRDDAGRILGTLSSGEDITERTRAEQLLRESEERFRSLVGNLPVGLYRSTSGPDGGFIMVNPAMARMHGYDSPEQMVYTAVVDTHVSAEAYARVCEELRIKGRLDGADLQLKKKDGTSIWCRVTAKAVLDDQGEALFVDGMTEDITERKQAEQRQAMMHMQLEQAQKLESIGRMAAGIAHEINTPTQYIGDNTRFLRDAFESLITLLDAFGKLQEAAGRHALTPELLAEVAAMAQTADLPYLKAEIPKAIDQSLDGVARVAKIVGAMKEFSHPGMGRKTAVDLNRAIESTVTVARNEWKYVADLVLDLEPSLPPVLCLRGEFNQVILNLVINAAQAIGEVVGGSGSKGQIVVSSRRDGDWVEVRIRDTGPGIPEKIRPRVFELFFTTKPVGKGTGQGLALARSVIVDKHGGTIHFETAAGQGTTFIVRLPLSPIPAAGSPDVIKEEAA